MNKERPCTTTLKINLLSSLFSLLSSLFSLLFSCLLCLLSLSLSFSFCLRVVWRSCCCGGLWRVVCGVCGSDDSQHGESVLARADYAPNWVAEHLGASSRRPRHPFPALMAGVSPAVYLCTRPEKTTHQRACHQPVQDNANCGTAQKLHCLDQSRHLCGSTTGM